MTSLIELALLALAHRHASVEETLAAFQAAKVRYKGTLSFDARKMTMRQAEEQAARSALERVWKEGGFNSAKNEARNFELRG